MSDTRPPYVDTLYRLAQGADYPDPPPPPPPRILREGVSVSAQSAATDPLDEPYEPPHAFAEGLVYGVLIASALWALAVLAIVGLQ